MSMSLRDQLLKAGLINKKQANEAERQQQRQERRPPPVQRQAPSGQLLASAGAQGAKAARDQGLNRLQHEKAEKKARAAQIKQLIDQNRLPAIENGELYNFIDGTMIRRIAVNASIRDRLGRGEIVIVRHQGRYDLVPSVIAARIRERDESAFVASGADRKESPDDDAYQGFSVPDDLMW